MENCNRKIQQGNFNRKIPIGKFQEVLGDLWSLGILIGEFLYYFLQENSEREISIRKFQKANCNRKISKVHSGDFNGTII